MALGSAAVVNELVSRFSALGLFRRVNTFETKEQPADGLTAALWVQEVHPYSPRSGLATTSAVVVLTLRIYQPVDQQVRDVIEPRLLDTVDVVLDELNTDFKFNSTSAEVALFGGKGVPAVSVEAGYIERSDGKTRVMDVTIPVIVNDAWTQGE